ncbi:hypothetical protein EYF80_037416 [Liparis tanakae]|uniref:Uncharacterized protein n=1 Tax=Liparis tanakae TaxID=230148 RepID=A0A4Z2GHL8_9TELE|nr:hypothetical protein EYF80_037416 [Liparis tanakae]
MNTNRLTCLPLSAPTPPTFFQAVAKVHCVDVRHQVGFLFRVKGRLLFFARAKSAGPLSTAAWVSTGPPLGPRLRAEVALRRRPVTPELQLHRLPVPSLLHPGLLLGALGPDWLYGGPITSSSQT